MLREVALSLTRAAAAARAQGLADDALRIDRALAELLRFDVDEVETTPTSSGHRTKIGGMAVAR